MTSQEFCRLLKKIEYMEFAIDTAHEEKRSFQNCEYLENHEISILEENRGNHVHSNVDRAKQETLNRFESRSGTVFIVLSVLFLLFCLATRGDGNIILMLFVWLLFEMIGGAV